MLSIKELKEATSKLSVLYVEDDISIQKIMTKYLEKFFMYVKTANDGEEGLELFKNNKYDIVITDLSMPKLDGLKMISKIKEIDENQSILITTAYSDSEYLLGAINAHVDGYIIKPFDYEALNFELFKTSQKLQKFKENEEYKLYLKKMLDNKTKEMSDNYEKTLLSMIELIEQRDTYTAGHSKRVAYYSKLIAEEMGYSEEECTLIHQAGILHDIGKIETPDAVLLNPKALNDIEYKLIQEHVTVGYKLLNSIPMFKPLADIVYSHHERYDGLGYPVGLKGDEIHKLARIMIVADAFDAMTTNRIYKAKKTVKEAIDELNLLSAQQFHPDVVKSAVIALKDIKLDENINQLPKTKVEEERFAYFYKDTLSSAYNQNYLDVILMRNSYELRYKYMMVISLHKFSQYNKEYSWEEGDVLLKNFSNTLVRHFRNDIVFRIFGDDFVIMSENKLDIEKIESKLSLLINDTFIEYSISYVDLKSHNIEKLTDIELLQAK